MEEESRPVDMRQFLCNPHSYVELEEIRQIFGRLNETLRSEGTAEIGLRYLNLAKNAAEHFINLFIRHQTHGKENFPQ